MAKLIFQEKGEKKRKIEKKKKKKKVFGVDEKKKIKVFRQVIANLRWKATKNLKGLQIKFRRKLTKHQQKIGKEFRTVTKM